MSSSTTPQTSAPSRSPRAFLATEVGSTSALLVATIAALVWANFPLGDTYARLWRTPLSLSLGSARLEMTLHDWVNDGLMTLFFFVIGLELSAEFSKGRLRDRRLVGVPMMAALGGMVVPALLYFAFTAGGPGQAGWGIPIATDTAFALGLLAVVGPRCPDPLRVFMLTLVVVDDIGAVLVVAFVYNDALAALPLLLVGCGFVVVVALRRLRVARGPVLAVLGVLMWVAVLHSGLHPTVLGIALGLLAPAYAADEAQVLRAREVLHEFTRRPEPRSARAVSQRAQQAISPNERMQLRLHPWTSYLVLPLFALANAGVALDARTLGLSAVSPVTWGVIAGLVLGKVIGICLGAWIGLRARMGILPGRLVWGQLAGGAQVAGVGFTMSLFIAELAFSTALVVEEAKVGILVGSVLSAVLGWGIFRLAWNSGSVCAPPDVGDEPDDIDAIRELADPVSEHDHTSGPGTAAVTLVEYGDYECPHCGALHPIIGQLRERFGDELRFVFRHFPLPGVHPHAFAAATAAEIAAAGGAFWPMHDRLFHHQLRLTRPDLAEHLDAVGAPRSHPEHAPAERVDADIDSGRRSGVRGTPWLFIDGIRYDGALDLDSLSTAIRRAREAADP